MLLCAGNADPAVLYLNTELMQNYWSTATTVTVLDIDSAVASDDPYEAQKTQFAAAKGLIELIGGDTEVLENVSRRARGALLPERREVVLRRVLATRGDNRVRAVRT